MRKKKYNTQNTVPKSREWWDLILSAWLASTIATLSAIFIGEVLGQVPCDLCWYQRIFMFPLPIILGIAAYRSDYDVWRYALPLSIAGLIFSLVHTLYFYGILPENLGPCTEGVPCVGDDMMLWEFLPMPVLASAAFAYIAFNLVLVMRRDRK